MKTIIKIYISLALVFSPIFLINSAYAAVGGWTLTNPIAHGASTVYTGVKNFVMNGKDYIKTGTVKITPTATQVAKTLARGAGAAALGLAVGELIGQGVDWVLDPANNQIKYKELTCSDGSQDCDSELLYQALWDYTQKDWHFTRDGACTATASLMASVTRNPWKFSGKYINGQCVMENKKDVSNPVTVYISINTKPNVDPAESEEKTIPLEVVAQKVISNAESGDATAQSATTAAAADVVAEAEQDSTKAPPITRPLEASAETKPADATAADKAGEASGTTKPNAETGATDIALEFPVFCNWAPTVCEAAQMVISFPVTLVEWWNTANSKAESWATSISEAWSNFRDWFSSDDDLPDDEKPQTSEIPTPELKEDAIRWSAQCPADAQVPINMQGVSSTITFSWSPWCQLLDMIKPAIIASAYIGAAFIVLGLRT